MTLEARGQLEKGRQRERGTGAVEIVAAVKGGCLTLVGKEVQKREDKEMNLFSIPIRHTELIFLT